MRSQLHPTRTSEVVVDVIIMFHDVADNVNVREDVGDGGLVAARMMGHDRDDGQESRQLRRQSWR